MLTLLIEYAIGFIGFIYQYFIGADVIYVCYFGSFIEEDILISYLFAVFVGQLEYTVLGIGVGVADDYIT